MAVMGPSTDTSKRDAKFVAEKLYPMIKRTIDNQLTAYWHVKNAERVLETLFKEIYLTPNPSDGREWYSYEYNRKKYLLVGFLTAKLPDEQYSFKNSKGLYFTGLRVKPENFNFTQDELEAWLVDLFFLTDMEDF